MSQVYVSMAMSLDGFITGPHDDAQNPAGINGMRLMDWLGGGGGGASGVEAYRPSDPNSQIVFDEALATGAGITGRRTMHGAYTAQQALKAGVLDAIEIQLRPVLLGQGRRLFDDFPPEHIELDLLRALEAPDTMHLRYQVVRG